MDARGRTLSEFQFKSLRNPKDLPSVFSLLVNANSKLQSVKLGPNNLLLMAYIHSVEIAVKAIFHVPEGVKDQASSPVSPVPSVSSSPLPDATTPSQFDEFFRRWMDPQSPLGIKPTASHLQGQGSVDIDHQGGGGVVEEDDSDPDDDDPGGYDFGEDEEEDPITGFPFAGMPGAKDIGYGFGEDWPDEIKGIRGMLGPLKRPLQHESKPREIGGRDDDAGDGRK